MEKKISQICTDHIFEVFDFMISDLGGVSNMGHSSWRGEMLESGGRQKNHSIFKNHWCSSVIGK